MQPEINLIIFKQSVQDSTLGAAPTTSQTSCLGCVINGIFVANDTVLTSSFALTIATLASIPPGIWIFTFNGNTYPNGSVTTTNNYGVRFNISTVINTLGSIFNVETDKNNYVNPVAFPIMAGTTCVTVTSTTTYYLNVIMSFSGDVRIATGGAFFRALRIG